MAVARVFCAAGAASKEHGYAGLVPAEEQPKRKKEAADASLSSRGGAKKMSPTVSRHRPLPSFRTSSSSTSATMGLDSGRGGGTREGRGDRQRSGGRQDPDEGARPRPPVRSSTGGATAARSSSRSGGTSGARPSSRTSAASGTRSSSRAGTTSAARSGSRGSATSGARYGSREGTSPGDRFSSRTGSQRGAGYRGGEYGRSNGRPSRSDSSGTPRRPAQPGRTASTSNGRKRTTAPGERYEPRTGRFSRDGGNGGSRSRYDVADGGQDRRPVRSSPPPTSGAASGRSPYRSERGNFGSSGGSRASGGPATQAGASRPRRPITGDRFRATGDRPTRTPGSGDGFGRRTDDAGPRRPTSGDRFRATGDRPTRSPRSDDRFDRQANDAGPRWGRSLDPSRRGPRYQDEKSAPFERGAQRFGDRPSQGSYGRNPGGYQDGGVRRFSNASNAGFDRRTEGSGPRDRASYRGGAPRRPVDGEARGAGDQRRSAAGGRDRRPAGDGGYARRPYQRDERDGGAESYGGPRRREVSGNSSPLPRDREMPANWGSVTRRGARALSYDGPSASEIWTRARDAGRDGQAGNEYARTAGTRPEPEDWEIALVEKLPPPARRNARSGGNRSSRVTASRGTPVSTKRGPRELSSPAVADRDLPQVAGNAKLEDATRAYSADRYQDALRILRKLSVQAPSSAAVKELLGLTLYRMGRWPLAVQELLAHHELTGSYDQYPVIADCFRAMRRYADAAAIWEELRQASPSAEVVAEGRLVAAGSLADQGDLSGAVKLLESSLRHSRPKASHLRQWYALADFYDRAGELPRARDLFSQIAAVDPDAYDVKQRLVALG
jgi:tetratricopeptide (TPR) repeat protein